MTNRIRIIATFCYLFMASCSPIYKMYVQFGTPKIQNEQGKSSNNVYRIYFDRFGFIYPDAKINDYNMKHCGSDFIDYYSRYQNEYRDICSQYGVSPIDSPDTDTDPLQAAVIDKIASILNKKVTGTTKLVILIHGYNENPLIPRNNTSQDEFKKLRESIEVNYGNSKFEFLEVYWDGCSAANGPDVLYPFNSFFIFDNAQFHSCNDGLELRRILNKLTIPKVYVITHSLGASVITTALFNVKKFPIHLYDDPKSDVHNFKLQYNDSVYESPNSKIVVGMLAPAIPGHNTFYRYFQRTVNGRDSIVDLTNFRFIVGYNTHDPVLRKFVNLPTKFGSTTLGCRRDEIMKTYEVLSYNRAILDTVDFSRYYDTNRGRNVKQNKHSFFKYMSNQKFNAFLGKVFED
jgi:hypothetical protein